MTREQSDGSCYMSVHNSVACELNTQCPSGHANVWWLFLSAWFYLELTKTQMTGHTCEGLFFSLVDSFQMEDSLLIQIFEWENKPLIFIF